MSIKTTPNPVIRQKMEKGVKTRKDQTQPRSQKNIKGNNEDLEDLGPLSYYTKGTEDEFLRQMFDFLESINIKNARKNYYSVPRRIWSIVVASIAGLVLIWALYMLVTFALDRLAWESRPSVYARLEGPYGIDLHSTPTLDLSLETGVLPATVLSFNNRTLLADASGVRAEFMNVTTRVRPADSASFDAVMRGSMLVDNLLGLCLLSASGATASDCGVITFANYTEAGIYISGSDTVTAVVAQYPNIEDATQGLNQLYQLSRIAGVIGNYAMVENRTVDYFYSSTRNNFYFTWTNGTWVYTINSSSLTALDSFMSEFPY